MVTNISGLNTFIQEIRNCKNKDQESSIIEKEQHKIRQKFSSTRGLTGDEKKKYIWKLLYIHVLGYDIDFGAGEACFLINSCKLSEKFTGYMAAGILSNMIEPQFYQAVGNAIKGDLHSSNEMYQGLALGMIGATAPEELVNLLKEVIHRQCNQFYMYYDTPNPWLQVKLLKLIQVIKPTTNGQLLNELIEILSVIIRKTRVTKIINKNNTDHGILFEAINVIIYYGDLIPEKLVNESITLLGIFLSVREPNIKYLALETICKFHKTNSSEKVITEHCLTVLNSLKDQDISIRRRALDILYLMCTQRLAPRIVTELLNYLNESDLNFKEELVLKVAILAEKFAGDLEWYIDIVVKLISTSGEFVTNEIWYRIIQIITGFGKEVNTELQKYAAFQLFHAVSFSHVHETLVKIASYILAEFSHFIVESGKSPQSIFDNLNKHYLSCSEQTRAMLLTSYTKLACKHPEMHNQVQSLLIQQSDHFNPELQQRGIEYQTVIQQEDLIKSKVFEHMPPFAIEIKDNNPLLKSMLQLKLGLASSEASVPLQKATSAVLEPTVLNELKKQTEKEIAETQESLQKTQIQKQQQQKELEVEQWIKSIKEHPGYEQYSSFILTMPFNLVPQLPRFSLSNYPNCSNLKQLMVAPAGVLYQSEQLQINYTSEFDKCLGRIAMQFVGNNNNNLTNIKFSVEAQNGLIFNISPVMTDITPNQVMMQVMCISPEIDLPLGVISFNCNDQLQTLKFGLPILVTKFIQTTIIPQEILQKHYSEYSLENKPIYFKLDRLLKNRSPDHTPQVIEKLQGLLRTLGIHSYLELGDDCFTILGAGQFFFKLENGEGEIQNYPVMVNLVIKNQAVEWIYCGVRVGGSDQIARVLFQIIEFIVNPEE